jgi:hypothetical protein
MKNLRQQLFGIRSTDDDSDRSCRDIPPESCHQQEHNLRANTANGAASKLAEQIAGPNLVLPWLFHLIGAPVWLFGFLMPIKQTFSLLPQLMVAGQIRRLPVRKWVWVGCGLVQALCLMLMIPVVLWLPPAGAGMVLLLLLIVFSSASGAASVAFQDVLGKTVDQGQRGKLLARRAFYGGILTVVAGLLLNRHRDHQDDLNTVLLLLLAAAVLWGVAALLFALIREFPGAVAGGRNAFGEVRAGFDLMRREPGFARFLQARGLLLAIELATPFYVLHAGQVLDLSTTQIGTLVVAIGAAQIVSSPFWGKLADRTSRKVMALSAVIGVTSAVLALSLVLVPAEVRSAGYALVFVLIGLAEAGARLGRKTYLVDATPHSTRATYTAFSNSLIGVVALLSGLTGVIAHQLGAATMLVVLLLLMLAAYGACRRMPEAAMMRG